MHAEVKRGTDGVWYARPYMGRDAEGKPIKPYKRFANAATREEAQALADTWAANLTADGTVRSARLADLLTDYVDMRERNGASPNSVKSYRLFTRTYVGKYLRGALAKDLTVMRLNRFEQRLLTGKEDGGAGLSRNSVLAVHNFLRGAYNHFVAAGLCDANPLLYVRHPSPERHEAVVLDEWDFPELDGELERLFMGEVETREQAKKAVYAFVAWLALRTGMRCGEVCAVRRRDVVRWQGFIHVGGTVIEQVGKKPYRRDVTKGRKCRNVSLADEDMAVVVEFIKRQACWFRLFGADEPLVTFDGSWLRPTTVSSEFKKVRRRLKLPAHLTFHGLRHTHATWCLSHGVDLKTLSERLGHADEATTLRIYAHVMAGRDRQAAVAFRRAAEEAKGGVTKE